MKNEPPSVNINQYSALRVTTQSCWEKNSLKIPIFQGKLPIFVSVPIFYSVGTAGIHDFVPSWIIRDIQKYLLK